MAIDFVKVELPSKGRVYEKFDATKVMVRPMRGKDEKIVAELSYDNFDRKFNALLKNVFVGVDTEKLTSGDRGYLVMWLVINSYSKDKVFEGYCQHCGAKVSLNVDLSKLDSTELPDDFKTPYPITLSDGTVIYVNLITCEDEIRLADMEKAYGENWLRRWALSISGDEQTFEQKLKFVEELPTRDLAKIRAFHEKFFHGPVMEWDYTCKDCGGAGRMAIPFQREWLFPYGKALAADYGATL
jgi:hypothetical protein